MMNFLSTISKKQILGFIVLILLIITIPVGVYLVQKQQIFKSKASSTPILDAFQIRDSSERVINCSGTNPPTCITPTQEVIITVIDLDALLPSAD